jgi:hypothetical protein
MFQNNLLMAAASTGATALTVDNSVLFNDDDSPRMTRTPATVGNRRRGSLSLWYKRCNLGSIMQLFNAGAGDDITFNANDKLTFADSSGVSYITTQVFRDTTAWGHLLFAWDTTLATAGDRLRIYHNGVEITAFDTETNPSQNDEFEISNTVQQTIGANESGTEEFDGYLSQFYYVDGQQLTPTDFGEFNNNVWRPIEYTAGSVGSAVTVALTDNSSDASDTTTYTFSSQSLGAAAANRKIVVGIVNYDDSPGTAASGVTVGGVTADRVQAMIGTGATMSTEIWQADVPTGTTGDVVVTWSAAVKSCGIGVWRVIGADSRPYGSKTTTADPGVVSMDIPAGGIGIGMSATGSGLAVTWTWTNLTEDFEDSITSGARSQWSGASAAFASAQSGLDITADASATADNTFVCSIWGPTDTTYGTNGFKLDFSDSDALGKDANVAASTTTYRYLKLDVTDNGASSTYVSLAEMQYYVGATLYPTQTMTSNTLPSPLVASASEDTGTGAELAFKAFDDDINTHWQTANGTVTGWLKIDLGSGNGIAPDSFRLGAPETPDRTPNGFTIQGSNNDSDWTILATYAGFSTPTPTARTYSGYAPITTGNNFVSSGLTTTDQVTDTPTNNFATFIDVGSGVTLSEGNLKITTTSTGWKTFPASLKIPNTGKWVYKVTSVSDTVVSPGVVGQSQTQDGLGVEYPLNKPWGDNAIAISHIADNYVTLYWGYQELTKEINGTSTTETVAALTTSDVLEFYLDNDNNTVKVYKNGVQLGSDVTGLMNMQYAAVQIYYSGASVEVDFGQHGFTRTDDTYNYLSTANFPTPDVTDGTENFQTTLYAGNTVNRNISQTGNSVFQPDMVWIKNRSAADTHSVFDAARGVTKYWAPDTHGVEVTDMNAVTAFSDNLLIDASGETKIGNMTGGGGLAAAFDGDNSKAYDACALTSTTGYCGIDWGSGNTKTITQMITIGSSDYGYNQAGSTISITIEGSTDNFSSSVVDLGGGTGNFTDATGTGSFKLLTPTSTTAYRYHRAKIVLVGDTGGVHFAQVQFFEDNAGATRGFTLGNGPGGWNDNAENFVAWQWLAGGGAGSSNTEGSINTTTTTVNTTSGCSISTYTGDGTGGATIGHGLGVPPEFLIAKSLAGGHNNICYFSGLGAHYGMYMDLSNTPYDLAIYWNDVEPTSSVITLGTGATNTSSVAMVMYAFAEVEGFSRFSSYVGNGAASLGTPVFCGFKPAWVMIKKTSGTGGWVIYDSQRSPYNEVDDQLLADTTAAETTGSEEIDFLATGFRVRASDSDINSSNGKYVYAAFAEYPFGGDGITPATAF